MLGTDRSKEAYGCVGISIDTAVTVHHDHVAYSRVLFIHVLLQLLAVNGYGFNTVESCWSVMSYSYCGGLLLFINKLRYTTIPVKSYHLVSHRAYWCVLETAVVKS